MPPIDTQEIIDDIQSLRSQHAGQSWAEFSKIIWTACRTKYLKPNGTPSEQWSDVAGKYLSQLKALQEF